MNDSEDCFPKTFVFAGCIGKKKSAIQFPFEIKLQYILRMFATYLTD